MRLEILIWNLKKFSEAMIVDYFILIMIWQCFQFTKKNQKRKIFVGKAIRSAIPIESFSFSTCHPKEFRNLWP